MEGFKYVKNLSDFFSEGEGAKAILDFFQYMFWNMHLQKMFWKFLWPISEL